MKIPSLFKNKETRPPWQWPLCKHPNTHSFRAGDGVLKAMDSAFFNPSDEVETPESWFTKSSDTASFTTDQSEDFGGESLEVIIRGVQSERLFFT
ncbi:transcription repressor OFP13-like [Cornus florida]|uniref:transcription repressor OFP13-like n=1 Tax=Cornus florida TaxID=4283 RepID=UPI0028A0B7DE|nr:transcription repressor OFP13-like [Cornus florida]